MKVIFCLVKNSFCKNEGNIFLFPSKLFNDLYPMVMAMMMAVTMAMFTAA